MSTRYFYEIRTYSFDSASQKNRFEEFVGKSLLPAYHRAGIERVGVFSGIYGPSSSELMILLPHPDLNSVADTADRLLTDKELNKSGRSVIETDINHPAFHRVDSRLLRAFTEMPEIELAASEESARSDRIFEIRIYESHSYKAAAAKRRMFNEGGEIGIFRKTGLSPVLFGETIAGTRMPSLLYMLTFPDMRARDEAWATFIADPEWDLLKSDPQYADTVSTITDIVLKPSPHSEM